VRIRRMILSQVSECKLLISQFLTSKLVCDK
jgi:hypothetical protein